MAAAVALEQHPTPPALAAELVALAAQHFGGETALWLEPCCGTGALLHRLPRPRVGIEIDAALAAAHADAERVFALDCRDVDAEAHLAGVPRDAVCAVTNPPFYGSGIGVRAGHIGNKRPGGGTWLRDFLTAMGRVAAHGVFLLPTSVLTRRWWADTVAQPGVLLELRRLGAHHFDGMAAGARVDVCAVALRLPAAGWAPPQIGRAQLAALEAAVAADLAVVPANDLAATASVVTWTTPRLIGDVTDDGERLAALRARVRDDLLPGRHRSTRFFVRTDAARHADVVARMRRVREVFRARFATSCNKSVSFSLSSWLEEYVRAATLPSATS
jgi:hypothetical protein